MRERECGYCHDFHEPDRCRTCRRFLRCQPDSEEQERETIGADVFLWTHYTRTCKRCGDANPFVTCEEVSA